MTCCASCARFGNGYQKRLRECASASRRCWTRPALRDGEQERIRPAGRATLPGNCRNPEGEAGAARPALAWQDMGSFMAALGKRDGIAAQALRFVILTAARTGEVRGMRWREVDLDAKVWFVPGDRMKAGKLHRVPLSSAAVAVLAEVRPLDETAR